ncbi:hemerythrin domain-containing protein [Salibacterium salarium]|uniref:hemerythrin domain-containing protein n=1 Tax=Salibacterium salarium TaxID=284579 RepID=UPI0027D83EC6|nr:hemerythrin domain-containing protein [Salibacterium salarium]
MTNSIKRHESLYSLSHHHHHGLFLSLNLKRVNTEKARYTAEKVLEDTRNFWNPGGIQHFREEEEILLPAFAQFASVDIPEIKTMLIDHVRIRTMMDKVTNAKAPDVEEMQHLGALLENHIRTEERIIFPMIERALPEEKLQELSYFLHVND